MGVRKLMILKGPDDAWRARPHATAEVQTQKKRQALLPQSKA
jgi:hypothetical protein